jgi:hypothetical protein
MRQDAVHETGGALGHAAPPAARTEPAPLARERDQPFEGAVATAEPRKAVLQDAAREEVPELLLHELRQTLAIGALRRRIQKRLQMLVDHAVEQAVHRRIMIRLATAVGEVLEVGYAVWPRGAAAERIV